MAVETVVSAKLTADDSNFTAGFARASKAVQEFTSSSSASQTKMAAIAGAVGGLASTFGMSMLAMAKSASDFAFNTVADFEQTRIGFEGIMGGAAQAQSMLSELQSFAASTPFEFTELATSTKQLLAVGYSASAVIPMMTKLGDATANLGLGSEALTSTIRAFGQIRGAGKAMTQDLYQISNALPGFNPFEAIGNSIGKTQAETRKMIEKGLIPADTAINAILAGMQKMPGAAGAMSRQVESIKGQVSNLKDTIQINLIKGFEDTGVAVSALKRITALVGPVMKGAFTGVKAVVGVLAPIFKTLGNAIGLVWKTVQPFAAILAGAFIGSLKLAASILQGILAPLNWFLDFLKQNVVVLQVAAGAVGAYIIAVNASAIATKVAAGAGWVWTAATKAMSAAAVVARDKMMLLSSVQLSNPIGLIVAAVATLIAVFVLAWKHSETFRNVVTAAFDAVGKVIGQVVGFVLQVLGGFAKGISMVVDQNTLFGQIIRAVYTAIYTVVKTVVVAILQTLSGWMSFLSEVMNTHGIFGEVIATVFNFIAKTVVVAIGTVVKLLGIFIQTIGSVIDSHSILGKVIATVFDFVWATVAKVVAGVSGLLGIWITGIADWLLANKDAMNLLAKIFGFIVGVVGDVVKGVLGTIKLVINGLSGFLMGAAKGAADFVDSIGKGLAKVPGMEVLGKLMSEGATAVRQAGATITGEMDKVAGSIQGAMNGIAKFQADALDSANYVGAVQGVKKVGQALTTVSKTALKVSDIKMGEQIVNAIAGGLATVGNFVKSIGSKVLDFTDIDASTFVSMVGGAIKSAKSGVDSVIEFVQGVDVGAAVGAVFDTISSLGKDVGQKIFDMGAVVASYTASGFTGKVATAISDTIESIKQKLGLSSAADILDKSNSDYAKAVSDAAKLTDPSKSVAANADVMTKVRESMKAGFEQVQGILTDLQKASADFAQSLKKSILGFAGLGGIELPDGFVPQAQSLIKNMEMRLKKSQDFAIQIGKLQALGLNSTSMKSILEQGPLKGAQFAESILAGGADAVKQINALEGSIAAVGATVGSVGSNAVYGGDIKSATDYLGGLTNGNPTLAQYGDVVTIADGAFKTVITIDGAKTTEETILLIQKGIESKFAELARALATKTGV